MPSVHQIHACSGPPSLTIIFVHGSGGHYLETWGPTASTESILYWLANDLKHVDIYSVGHEANLASMSDYATIEEYADVIAFALRPTIRTQNVLFVGHSLGGIIIKQLIINHADNFSPASLDFCFIGTPHNGANFAWLRFVHGLIFRNEVGKLLLGHNAELQQINTGFLKPTNRCVGQIICVAERRRIFGMKIMSDHSAMIGDPRAINLPVSKNHHDLSKPRDRNDVVYQAILRLAQSRISKLALVSDSNFTDDEGLQEALEQLKALAR